MSATRQQRFWIAVALLIASLSILGAAWNSFRDAHSASRLQAPGFSDISAFSANDAAKIDAWLQEQMVIARYPSLSVAIVRDGKIVYQNAFGFENIKAGRKASPDTSYNVASVTKVFTTSFAVMLHESGVINLDHPAAKYLPKGVLISQRPEVGARIPLRQLASHTSGLPRGIPGPVQSVNGRYQLEPRLFYGHLAKVKLKSDPGTAELYSNLGMGLLGHILELAAGKPYEQLLREMILDPLHLDQTAINPSDNLRLATGYSSDLPRVETGHSYKERLAPSGGLVASAPDLAHFLSAQMKPGFFSTNALKELHTPTKLSNGSLARTALGWTIRTNHVLSHIVEKNGGRENCSAWIGFAPQHGVGVAVVVNCGAPDVNPIGRWLLEWSIRDDKKAVAP